MSKLEFIIDRHDGEGAFVHKGMRTLGHKVDEALERLEAGKIGYGQLADKMEAVLAKEPLLIEAYATKGYALFEMDLFDEASATYAAGVAACDAVMPDDYVGKVSWGDLDNRAYLRCLHGLGTSLLAAGIRDDGLAVLDRLIALNPDDNQGVRFVLASEHLRAGTPGKTDAALGLADDQGTMHAEINFDAALHHFRAGDIPEAIASVRRGVLGTRFVLQALVGGIRLVPPPRDWEGNRAYETAESHVRGGAPAWDAVPGGRSFLAWAAMQPAIRADMHTRQAYDKIMGGRDFERRSVMMHRLRMALEAVDADSGLNIILDAGIGENHDWASTSCAGPRM